MISDDVRGWQALHWTGHYIQDPTLAFAHVRPWTTGRYQILGFAKVWKGTARLPSEKRMFELYRGPGKEFFGDGLYGTPTQEARARYFVAWLNSESLKFGGRFVDTLPDSLEYVAVAFFKYRDMLLTEYICVGTVRCMSTTLKLCGEVLLSEV